MTDDRPPLAPMSLLQSGWHAVRAHPVVTTVLVVISVAAVAFSAFIGLTVIITIALLGIVGAGGVVLWWLWTRRRPVEARPVGAAAGRIAIVAVALSGVVTLGAIQVVPYGRSHSNPPVTGEPQWANDGTRELMVNACFACHSNDVEYPRYASVAPISWMVQRHVDEGREKVNYSEFATDQGDEPVRALDRPASGGQRGEAISSGDALRVSDFVRQEGSEVEREGCSSGSTSRVESSEVCALKPDR